jgi:Histidine kinase-, DNA gyrase B-, and HSP90-like ATPase
MNSQIEKTRLWAISLGSKDADQEIDRKKERLRSALSRFREHISVLTSRISATFPQLTVHDVTHLDALWETADLVAGMGYPLNPLEAFVLGGTILLHDAAHCFEAYEGGQHGVRSTLVWRDALASEIAAHPEEPREKIEQYCDFTAIRLLHARQAEKLGEREWKSENGETSFFLIEDADLRSRYGALIGQIAASHNWSIDDVKSRLRAQVNAPGGWPGEWRVDPIKIACLLRCADAAHIDHRRAPDFLLALIRRSGVSLDHWKAQNWLASVDVDQSDPSKSSLLFTSTHAFKPTDSSAWWVAYDAITILDAEIRASNNLLLSRVQKDSSSPAFKMQRVTGANSPTELCKSVETEGWMPTSAKIHVGNLERLVKTLGGQSLYGGGDNFSIVVRELIQNARDAVAARRSLAPGFVGSILVRITSKSDTQTFVEIRDDGVGMSERTMTGALLDFGTSFWASDLVRSEFPGLRSSSFRPIGKFGIGFYSVFMAASEVLVASRRFDEGLSDVTRLHFADGLTLRPILAKGADENYDVMSSTNVRLTIDEPIDSIKNRWINKGQPQNEWQVPLQNYLAAITAGLDVSVACHIERGTPVTVHESVNSLGTPEKVLEWIEGITFADVPSVMGSSDIKKYVRENADRMRSIEHNDQRLGFAALLDIQGVGFQFLTTDTIGGLTNNVVRGSAGYMGYMENYPASAKRDPGKKVASSEVLQSWATEQVSILKQRNATPEQLYWAASSMSNLDVDPVDVINFPVVLPNNQYTLLTFEEIFNALQQTPVACLKSRQSEFSEINIAPLVIDGLPTLRPLWAGNLIRLHMENGRPKYSLSLLGCLDRLVAGRGRELCRASRQLGQNI